MPCSVSLNTDASHAEAVYFGTLTAADLEAAAREIMALMQGSNTMLLLADCTGVVGGHSVFDLYALADWLRTYAPRVREAVVLPTLDLAAENVRFWETTCRNRGLAVRIFNDRERALEWLYDKNAH
jgi:hypothetical protein